MLETVGVAAGEDGVCWLELAEGSLCQQDQGKGGSL